MFKAYPKVAFSVVILVLIGLTLILTACGSTDHGGYAEVSD